MSIQITSNSSHLVINNNGTIRTINKQSIREISILRDTTLKIDIGGGALRNIFFRIADITSPQSATPERLVELVNDMLTTSINVDGIANQLNTLTNSVASISANINAIPSSSIQQPSLIDESNPHSVYSGFAPKGTLETEPHWLIMRTTITNEIQKNEWSKNDAIWDNREQLDYA